jgi:hypothetical protein
MTEEYILNFLGSGSGFSQSAELNLRFSSRFGKFLKELN